MTTRSAPSTPAGSIDWEGSLWECIAHLQALIRMDTVNPPGREIGVARYLDDVLRGKGVATTLLEPAPGRAALVGRLSGSGRGRPLILMAHMDVVGVERARWKTNPFGGEILHGYLYGRGAIDDKGMLAVNLQVMLLLSDQVLGAGRTLDRDVVFLATSDEEGGGEFGIDWLVAHRPELLEAEFALNEGGRLREIGGRLAYGAVQCGEKVSHVVRLTATGPPGHASIPIPGNAVGRLARAVAIAAAHAEPIGLTDIVQRYFAGLSTFWPDEQIGAAMAAVSSGDPGRVAEGARVLSAFPSFNAVLRNGIAPTMLEAGFRSNVIPAEARATLNVRTLPGQSLEDLLARLGAAIGDPLVEATIERRGDDAPSSPIDSPMFTAIESAISGLAPGVPTVPYLSTGATDSVPLRRLGVQAYGLLPFPLSEEDEGRMHGHDERVAVPALDFGLRLTWDIVHRLAAPA